MPGASIIAFVASRDYFDVVHKAKLDSMLDMSATLLEQQKRIYLQFTITMNMLPISQSILNKKHNFFLN